MIKSIITIGTLLFSMISYSQINAITETGDEVILYNNNTWKYSNDSLNNSIEILKNEKLFTKNNH
jgi:hypothetical protein